MKNHCHCEIIMNPQHHKKIFHFAGKKNLLQLTNQQKIKDQGLGYQYDIIDTL